MPRRIAIAFLLIVLAGWAAPSRADFVISIGSTSIDQGSSGTIGVYLTSTGTSGSPDLLNFYSFALQVTGPNELQFAPTQSQDFSYLNAPTYVFNGDSNTWITGQPNPIAGYPTTTAYTNDTFIAGDSTYDGNPVSLTASNTPVLLATLTLSAAMTNAGDVYSISLVPPTGTGSVNANASTFFDNFNFNTGTETSAVAYTSTSGTVTIIAATVPEPASIILGLSAMAMVAGARIVRRRGSRRPAA